MVGFWSNFNLFAKGKTGERASVPQAVGMRVRESCSHLHRLAVSELRMVPATLFHPLCHLKIGISIFQGQPPASFPPELHTRSFNSARRLPNLESQKTWALDVLLVASDSASRWHQFREGALCSTQMGVSLIPALLRQGSQKDQCVHSLLSRNCISRSLFHKNNQICGQR